MRKLFYVVPVAVCMAAMALAVQSCDKMEMSSSLSKTYERDKTELSFRAISSTTTKSIVSGTAFPSDRSVKVSAWVGDDVDAIAGLVYFSGQNFNCDESVWKPQNTLYWPISGSLDMFAISAGSASVNPVWSSADSISFSCSDATADDILVGGIEGASASNNTMVFVHTQSRLSFSLKANEAFADNSGIKVTSIVVNSVKPSTTVSVTRSGSGVSVQAQAASGTPVNKTAFSGTLPLTADAQQAGDLIVPSNQAATTVTINYTIHNGSEEGVPYSVTKSLGEIEWTEGKHYIYAASFTITPMSLLPATVEWETQQVKEQEPVDLSMVDINGEEISSRTTANCYVVHSTGTYLIPLVYGNAITDGSTNASSYTLVEGEGHYRFVNYLNANVSSPYIETDTGVQASSASAVLIDTDDLLLSEFSLVEGTPCRYLKFKVTQMPSLGGNATVAVKDSEGKIMWSWHIWAYPFELNTVSHTNTNSCTYEILDVNLGWVKEDADSKFGTSPYYQWGRKDPFPRVVSHTSSTMVTLQTGTFTVSQESASSVAQAIMNPATLYKRSDSFNIWVSDNGSTLYLSNYWDADWSASCSGDKTVVKTIYDPCPAGFVVPCKNTFDGYTLANSSDFDYGRTWDGRFYPALGELLGSGSNVGKVKLLGEGFRALLSSSETDSSTNQNTFYFYTTYDVYPNGIQPKVNALSICPVKL